MNSPIRVIKFIALVFSLFFMLLVVLKQWEQIKSYDFSIDPVLFCISLLILILSVFLGAIGWHFIIKILGQPQSARTNIRIWALSSITRYLPGGIWGYVSRAALCKEEGIKISVAMVALYLEIFLLFLATLVTGLPAGLSITGYSVPVEYLIAAGLVASFLIHPKFLALMQHIPGKAGEYIQHIRIPTLHNLAGVYVFYLIFLVIYGIAFLIFVSSLVSLPPDTWLVTASVFPLAFCIGFILFIFPSGIGVRESMIYILMLDITGPAGSIIIAIGSRLWTILAEILFLLIVYIIILRSEE